MRQAKPLAAAALVTLLAALAACGTPPAGTAPVNASPEDPNLWLEEVTGEKPLAWVREHNAVSEKLLTSQPEFAALKAKAREVLNSRERIPKVTRIGAHLYNFWTDEARPRGIWRRTTLAEYGKPQVEWETVLDIDALGRAEKESWVFGKADCLPARNEAAVDRCMVSLSRGGSDAKVWREFDLKRKQFVDGGFVLPEAKSSIDWIDRDTLYVETDFGPGTMTTSGYPRSIREWKRGTPLAQAKQVFEGPVTDVGVGVSIDHTPGFERHVFSRATTFFESESFVLREGKLVRIEHPADARLRFHREWLMLALRTDWTVGGRTYKGGSLVAARFDDWLRGDRRMDVLFEPTPARSLARGGVTFTRSRVLLDVQDQVVSELEEVWHEQGTWKHRRIATPPTVTASVAPLHDDALAEDPLAEAYLLDYEGFLTPSSLLLGRTGSDAHQLLKRAPQFFDATGMRVEQRFATSRDGTKVPYFVVWPKGATESGDNPTLLYGYGGFQISEQPFYLASMGPSWVARGGVFVLANIRGGGEFGPAWHRAALKENKQRSYDDFIAIAEDLVARKVTSPKHLGIMGGSNGGLLVGAVFTQRPDLFNAMVCQVPLLDMKRFNTLLAGASWMAEYGNPDVPEQWAYISKYSPYQNLSPQKKYPLALFSTSTRDDRVHPAHARKMVARMEQQGHPVLYYENIEGGHGLAADAEQRAHIRALEFSYLWMRLARPR